MKKSLSILFLILSVTFVVACAPKTEDVSQSEDAMAMEEPVAIEDGVYTIDPSSALGWSAKRLAANPHIGTVAIQSGELTFRDEHFVSGEFIIDLTQITETKNNERVLNHLKSDDFFAVDQYPTAKLVVTGFEGDTVSGDLTIKDQTNPVSFPARITATDGTLQATAQFEIDRTKWGINFDSGSVFQNLGDRAIEDMVKFDLNLVMTK